MANEDNPERVPEDAPGSGEDICRRCEGTGKIDGETCPECKGTGRVNVPIGGA